MARELKIVITAEGAQAKSELASVERGIDSVTKSTAQVTQVMPEASKQVAGLGDSAKQAADKVTSSMPVAVQHVTGLGQSAKQAEKQVTESMSGIGYAFGAFIGTALAEFGAQFAGTFIEAVKDLVSFSSEVKSLSAQT